MDLLEQSARTFASELQRTKTKCVLQKAGTSGLIAATLARVAGISAYLCGSAVVYREQTKCKWLGLDPELLAENTAVSGYASREIGRGVLEQTPEATMSLGITGHLGPQAPPDLDGATFMAIWSRGDSGLELVEESFDSA